MYKSLRIFAFEFLLSSLVILVLVPFLNQQQQNSFLLNPAMAQVDEKYGDSKKDNRDNKTGEQGNAGPSGITELLFGVNVYEIVEERQIPASGNLDLFAVCDLGDTVITGGWDQNAQTNPRILQDRPFTNDTISAWKIFVVGAGGEPVEAAAYCFDNPPLRP
jgi:hypothetical protein